MSLPVFAAASEALHLLGWSLLHFLWEGTLVVLLLSAVLATARQSSAQARYAICCASLALMALCPIVTFAYLEQASGRTTHVGLIAENAGRLAVAQEQSIPASLLEHVTAIADKAMPWALAVWMIGVLVFVARAIAASMAVRRLRNKSIMAAPESLLTLAMVVAERLGVSQAFEVFASGSVTTPTVVGWLKPVILFPVASLMSLAPEQLEAMLAHELAHIRRRDYLVNALQLAVETLLFYHPAVWWVSRQIRSEREHCCDDVAVAVTGSPLVYAKALYLLEEQRATAPALTLGANGGELKMRIKRLLTGESLAAGSSGPATWMVTMTLLFLISGIVVSMAGIGKARAQSPAPPSTPMTTDKNVTESDPRLRVVYAKDPDYPEIAKAAHVSGTVMVAVTVNPKGKIIEAAIKDGEPMLRQAALEAVQQYRFAPFTPSGDTDAKAIVTVNFVLYGEAQNNAAKPDLSCTFYDDKAVGHDGTCDEANGQQYICRRNDGDNTEQSVQLQPACREKVEAFKKQQGHLEREAFQRVFEARRANQ